MNNPETISLKTTLQYIRADMNRYKATDHRSHLASMVMCPGMSAGIWYRIGYWIWHYGGPLPSVMRLMRPPYIVLRRFVEIISGIYISTNAKIGPGLYINHFGCIYIGLAELGSNCNIS